MMAFIFLIQKMLLLLLIGIVLSAREKCGNYSHTRYYNEHLPIKREDFFIIGTFDNRDPCTPISNQAFRKLYPQYDDLDVEHIIDNQFSVDNNCNKNYMGNLVMANREWNQQVGQMCWKDVQNEKNEVYGEIFALALYNVKKCCKIGNVSFSSIMIIATCMLVALVGIVFFIYQLKNGEIRQNTNNIV